MKKESVIQKEIMDYLKTIRNGHFFKVPAGSYSRAGIADIIGCFNGRFVAIEVKTETGKMTPLQKNFLINIQETGGIHIVARNVSDVIIGIH